MDLNELLAGTQIQLITYLDSMVQSNNAKPAAILYFSLIDPIIKSNINKSDEKIEEELKKKFRMNGMVLKDINIIKKMDKTLEYGLSKTVPVSVNKDGSISKAYSKVVTEEEFAKLQKLAEEVIKQIAHEILEGNIDVKPAYYKKSDRGAHCQYCEYKSICRFNPKIDNYLYITDKSNEEILKEIIVGNNT